VVRRPGCATVAERDRAARPPELRVRTNGAGTLLPDLAQFDAQSARVPRNHQD